MGFSAGSVVEEPGGLPIPWGCRRIRHDLVTKEQQQNVGLNTGKLCITRELPPLSLVHLLGSLDARSQGHYEEGHSPCLNEVEIHWKREREQYKYDIL